MKSKIEYKDGQFYLTYKDYMVETKPLSYFIELYAKYNTPNMYTEEAFGFDHINNKHKDFIYNVGDIVYSIKIININEGIFQLFECKIKRRFHKKLKNSKFDNQSIFDSIYNMLKIKTYEVEVIRTIYLVDSINYLSEFNKLSNFEKSQTRNPNTIYEQNEIVEVVETEIYDTANKAEQKIVSMLYDGIKIRTGRISNIQNEISLIQNTIKKIITGL